MTLAAETPEEIDPVLPAETGIVQGSLGRMSFLIALGWLGTNAGLAIGEFVLKFYLKDRLLMDAAAISGFFAIGQFTNYIKPLAGICTDSIPLFGTRRRYYLLLSLLGTGLFFLLLAVVPRERAPMLLIYVLLYSTVVFTSTTLGGVMVEVGMQHRAEGRLTSQRIGMFRLGSLIGAPIGGWLVGFPFAFGMVFAGIAHLIMVPLYWVFLREPRTAKLNTSIWQESLRQFEVVCRSRVLLAAAGMIFLIAASPGFDTPLLFYQTNTLHFKPVFIGLLTPIGAGTGLCATIVYFTACRRFSLKVLLFWSIVIHALGVLFYLRYNSMQSAILISALSGVTVTLATLPVYDLACRATPKGSEAIGYAVMMSVWNLTNKLSDYTGSVLYSRFHLTFLNLLWVDAGTTLLVLVAIPLLPAALLRRRDSADEVAAAA